MKTRMPFTFAHAAAAWPFRRTRLVLSAVVTGTFAPDFEYFLRLAPGGNFGHTLRGAVLWTLPLALIAYWMYQCVVKGAIVSLLPEALQSRLTEEDIAPLPIRWPNLLLILGSLTVGITTHIAWDSFTHPTSWLYGHWAALRQSAHVPALGLVPYYKIAQHGSTLLGSVILALWFRHWYRTTPPQPRASPATSALRRWRILALLLGVAVAGSIARAAFNAASLGQEAAFGKFVVVAVVTFVAILWWQLVAYGLLITRLKW